MRPSIDLRTLGGCLALAGMLLMASPGVRVHADEPVRESSSKAPAATCNAPAEMDVSVDPTHLVEYYRQQALQAPPSGDEPILLNGRGYNYGPPPSVDPTRVAFESSRRQ